MKYSQTYRAPYLVQWNARMSQDNMNPLTDRVVEAVLHAQGIPFEHTDEFRSVYSYGKLVDALENYRFGVEADSLDRNMLAGLNHAFRIFAKPSSEGKLSAISLTDSASALFTALSIKGDKSAGLTAYGTSKLESFTVGLDKAVKILTQEKAPAPCLAGFRTQRKQKTRLVWMYPLEMTILEAIIARPLISHFLGVDHPMTFGQPSHRIGMRLRASASSNKFHYSVDYSHFDGSVTSQQIKRCFNAFRTWFDLDQEIYPGVKLEKVFSIVERYFINTTIVMPHRGATYPVLVRGKSSGVPSGSYFTQMVDSFANVSLLEAASTRFGLSVKDRDLFVLGDDCLFFCNASIDVVQLSNYLSTFGFVLNPSKGSHGLATAPVEFLGRSWVNGLPMRTMHEISRGALYPERYRKYSERAGVRHMQALSVVSSYLLTGYLADPPVGTERFGKVYSVTPELTTGFTKYLLEEGLLSGRMQERAIW